MSLLDKVAGFHNKVAQALDGAGLGFLNPAGTISKDPQGVYAPDLFNSGDWVKAEQTRVATGAAPATARPADPALPVVATTPGAGTDTAPTLPPDFYTPTPVAVTPSPEPEHHAAGPVGRNSDEERHMSNDPSVLGPDGRRQGSVAAGSSAFARVSVPTSVRQG